MEGIAVLKQRLDEVRNNRLKFIEMNKDDEKHSVESYFRKRYDQGIAFHNRKISALREEIAEYGSRVLIWYITGNTKAGRLFDLYLTGPISAEDVFEYMKSEMREEVYNFDWGSLKVTTIPTKHINYIHET